MECEPRDCEVETALDRLLNDIVVPATEITVTTWIYFGKMSTKQLGLLQGTGAKSCQHVAPIGSIEIPPCVPKHT